MGDLSKQLPGILKIFSKLSGHTPENQNLSQLIDENKLNQLQKLNLFKTWRNDQTIILITVNRDQSFKLAKVTTVLRKSFHKKNSQKPNFGTLIDRIALAINRRFGTDPI